MLGVEAPIVGGLDAADDDAPGRRRLEPDEASRERRLSRPRLADDADALALADLDRDTRKRRDLAAAP